MTSKSTSTIYAIFIVSVIAILLFALLSFIRMWLEVSECQEKQRLCSEAINNFCRDWFSASVTLSESEKPDWNKYVNLNVGEKTINIVNCKMEGSKPTDVECKEPDQNFCKIILGLD